MRRVIVVFLVCLCVLGINAQDMSSVFTSMPDQHIPQLESAWRKDLVDLYKSGKEARLKNRMDGFSQLDSLTENYMMLRTTERSCVEMKLLPLVNNTYVVCMVSTVYAPVPDSRIEFFTTSWEPLPATDLFESPSGDWYLKVDVDKESDGFKAAISTLDMDLVRYQLSPDSYTLTATYSTPLYLDEESRERLKPYLAEPKVYTWEKYRFK